jgi:hypothetical protein
MKMIAVACVLRETSRYGLDTIRQLLQAEGMCNRARNSHEPEALHTHFGTLFSADRPMDNRFNPSELMPRSRSARIFRSQGSARSSRLALVIAGNR